MLEQILPKDYLAPLDEHFDLIKILGYGGMGVCYLARSLKNQKQYALKVLHPDWHNSPEAVEQLKKEARFEQMFQHEKHIIHTYDLLNVGALVVKVMEVVSGMTLKRYLQHADYNPKELCHKVTIALTNALEAIHASGIVHCDIKPDNIFIGTEGVMKLFDFGIARMLKENTPVNFSAFSLNYSSPRVKAGLVPRPEDDFYSLNRVKDEILGVSSKPKN